MDILEISKSLKTTRATVESPKKQPKPKAEKSVQNDAASLMLNGLGPNTTAGDVASLLEGALSQGLDSTKLVSKPNGTQYARLQYRTRELATRALSAIASSVRNQEGFFPASVSVDRWSSKERRVKKGSQSTNGFVAGNAHSAAASDSCAVV